MSFDSSAARSGAVASDNPSYRGAWLCYINGIEVPITGFSVSSGVWQIPQFQIYLLPDPVLEELGDEDRVPVALFYLDQWIDPIHPEWRLLVDGEIIGRSTTHVEAQRMLSFTCLGNIHVFKQLYFFFMNTVDDIVAAQSPDVAATGITASGLFYPYSLFHSGLFVGAGAGREIQDPNNPSRRVTDVGGDGPDPQDDVIKAPYELVYNVVRGLIDKNADPENRHRSVPMLNFFARYVRKVRLQNRFVRLPQLEDLTALDERRGVFPIFNAARNDEALAAMQRQMAARVSNSGPVWNVLQQTLGTVYMEIGMVTNPACVVTNLQGEIQRLLDPTTGVVDQNVAPPSTPTGTTGGTTPTTSPDAPVVRPRDVYQQVYDRLVQRAQLASTRFRTADVAAFRRAIEDDTVQGAPVQFAERLYQELLERDPALSSVLNGELRAIQQQLPNSAQTEANRQNAERTARRNNVTPPAPPTTDTSRTSPRVAAGVDPTTPVRLAQYFVKPQFLFGVPPHCNVFFPSMITTWGDDVNIINQPTRIYVNDSVMTRLLRPGGANREFMLHALTVAYPEEADAVLHHHVAGGDGDERGAAGAHDTGKDLLIPEEELYKGPVVARMELPSWFQMLMQTRNAGTGSDATPPSRTTPTAPNSPPPVVAQRPPGPNDATTGANAEAPAPQLPPLRPRGRAAGPDYWPNAWRPSPQLEALARGQRVTSDPTSTVASILSRVNSSGNYQGTVYPGLRRLGAFLRRMFPQIRGCGYVSGYPTDYRTVAGTTHIDPHKDGRAVDLMIPTVGHQPNHAAGDPVAQWLVEHAEEIGVQYFIWARTQFFSDRRARVGRFSPYTRADGVTAGASGVVAPHSARFDHFDHIHLELNLAGSNMQTPWFLQNSGANEPTQAPTAAINIPRAPTATTTPPTITRGPGPRPNTAPVTVVTRPATTVRTGTNEGGDEPTRDQSFQRLFRLYAQYEYLRQRYMQRNASVNMIFNPYVVPGFPCVIFDSQRTSSDRVGYVMAVTHSGTAGGDGQANWSTAVTVTCLRRFKEFLNDIKNDCERFAERVTAAPAEIIPEIRRVIQDDDNAERFYQLFFHGGARPEQLPAAFHFDRVMGYVAGNDVETFQITGEGVDAAARIRERADQAAADETLTAGPTTSQTTPATVQRGAPNTLTVSHNIDPNRELRPLPSTVYEDCFNRADTALQMCARPACTLVQYVRFWHAGRTLNQCIADGVVEGEENDFAYIAVQEQDISDTSPSTRVVLRPSSRQPATYWRRIYRLRPGPGRPLTESERGYVTEPPGPSHSRTGLPADYPQTRTDWDTILLAYRERARSLVSPGL